MSEDESAADFLVLDQITSVARGKVTLRGENKSVHMKESHCVSTSGEGRLEYRLSPPQQLPSVFFP